MMSIDIFVRCVFDFVFKAVDSRSGFKSFLNENQIQSETRTFTIITRVYADLPCFFVLFIYSFQFPRIFET
jgi:hypothetical protein